MRISLVAAILCALMAIGACAVSASPVTLTHNNSQFTIDPAAAEGASVWSLDQIDQLYIQQWYYKLSPTGPVYAIGSLGTPAQETFTVPLGGGEGLVTTYTTSGFKVSISYTLRGGAPESGSSDISEQFSIVNTSNQSLYFSLFEYSDFDLMPNVTDDRGMFTDSNTVEQWDGQHLVRESVVRTPTHYEIGHYKEVSADMFGGNLHDSVCDEAVGPTDLAWAFQWDMNIAAGNSVDFSKDKAFSANSVPEPISVLLGVMGLATVSGFRRFRK